MTKYKECKECGAKKTENTHAFCSSRCKRKFSEKIDEGRIKYREMIIKEGRKLIENPINWKDLNVLLCKKSVLSMQEGGRILSSLAEAGYLKVYPSIYSSKKVVYLGNDYARAKLLYDEITDDFFGNCGEATTRKMLQNRGKRMALRSAVRKLYAEGKPVNEIATILGLEEKSIKAILFDRRY